MTGIVNGLASQERVHELCRRGHVSVATWRAVTDNDIAAADHRTGRGVSTTQAAAAGRVGKCTKTIQRVRKINQHLGICIELYRGRELGRAERLDLVHRHHGHQQRGLASVFAYGVFPARYQVIAPRPGTYAQVNSRVHLPRSGHDGYQFSSEIMAPVAAADAAQTRRTRWLGMVLCHELLAHPEFRLLDRVRPGAIRAQLRGHYVGGWQGGSLGDALIEAAHTQYINPYVPSIHPHTDLQRILRFVPTMAYASPPPRSAPAPCRRGDCDHGWITVGVNLVTKCPDCPNSARANLDLNDDDTEPRF